MYGYDTPEMYPRKNDFIAVIDELEYTWKDTEDLEDDSLIEQIKDNIMAQIAVEKVKARAAKWRMIELLENKIAVLYCKKFGKFGRVMGNIKLNANDDKTINDIMVEEGFGTPYYGGTKKK